MAIRIIRYKSLVSFYVNSYLRWKTTKILFPLKIVMLLPYISYNFYKVKTCIFCTIKMYIKYPHELSKNTEPASHALNLWHTSTLSSSLEMDRFGRGVSDTSISMLTSIKADLSESSAGQVVTQDSGLCNTSFIMCFYGSLTGRVI